MSSKNPSTNGAPITNELSDDQLDQVTGGTIYLGPDGAYDHLPDVKARNPIGARTSVVYSGEPHKVEDVNVS